MTSSEVQVAVELFVLADAVTVMPDGRVNILGAVPEFWTVPADHPHGRISAALTISTNIETAEAPIPFGLRLTSDGEGVLFRQDVVLGPAVRDPDAYVAGARAIRSMPIHLDIVFGSVGPHRLELVEPGGDRVIAAAPFSVRFV